MEKSTIIQLLARLGKLFRLLGTEQPWPGFESGVTQEEYESLQAVINREHLHNPWFTKENIRFSLRSLADMLEQQNLEHFTQNRSYASRPKRVAIIMPGNIPLVGFHDLLCVLLSGNIAVCKLSSGDTRMLPAFLNIVSAWNPDINTRVIIALGPIKQIDAVIATGSDNSVSHFESYFGKYPHIFRNNRTSVAVLNGRETDEELADLGKDMFQYFGLGCRNVSKIFLPETFNINRLFEAIVPFGDVINHHKYANNYDYNRTIYLMNSVPFLDNNFCLLKEDNGLHSPLSVFFTHRYSSMEEVNTFLETHSNTIQTVVGKDFAPFGSAQTPAIDDFADGIDTLLWLETL